MTRRWRPNIGSPPERDPDEIAALDAAQAPDAAYRITHVYVRLRNGMIPKDKWPTRTGRRPDTRWTLTGDDYDITHWIEA